MTNRRIVPVIVLALAVMAGWLYASPYIAFRAMAKAAETGDAVALADYVDFPAVKESLKGSLTAQFNRSLSTKASDSPFAGLAVLMAGAAVNTMVDQMVTPEGIATMYRQGKAARPAPRASSAPAPTPPAAGQAPEAVVTRGYRGWDRFEVRAANASAGTSVALTMRREGLTTWRLRHVDLDLGGDK